MGGQSAALFHSIDSGAYCALTVTAGWAHYKAGCNWPSMEEQRQQQSMAEKNRKSTMLYTTQTAACII